jgi:hypothetical protein
MKCPFEHNCPSCVFSIPIGGEKLACYIKRQGVSITSPTCSYFKKYKSNEDTRISIKAYNELKGIPDGYISSVHKLRQEVKK